MQEVRGVPKAASTNARKSSPAAHGVGAYIGNLVLCLLFGEARQSPRRDGGDCGSEVINAPTVCHEIERRKPGDRNCKRDEGRPFGVGWQEQAPNRLTLLRPKVVVVSG